MAMGIGDASRRARSLASIDELAAGPPTGSFSMILFSDDRLVWKDLSSAGEPRRGNWKWDDGGLMISVDRGGGVMSQLGVNWGHGVLYLMRENSSVVLPFRRISTGR